MISDVVLGRLLLVPGLIERTENEELVLFVWEFYEVVAPVTRGTFTLTMEQVQKLCEPHSLNLQETENDKTQASPMRMCVSIIISCSSMPCTRCGGILGKGDGKGICCDRQSKVGWRDNCLRWAPSRQVLQREPIITLRCGVLSSPCIQNVPYSKPS